ncbi:ferrous iron transport protein B [Ruminococcaceae bacterium YRB3002]|nr:ferrous iron transport protein B [Ruminococcaceae bacterium YRB3002]
MTDKNEIVIALLGQPNSGKSTLFNALTGLRQHVGNWPGKTVEKKEGSFVYNDRKYLAADLPGTYSLSANSDEEIITRDYIASGKADVVCILADSSQLERSLYMLSDFAGIDVPCFLVLNMDDVAREQGKEIRVSDIEDRLGIPVVLFSATDRKGYDKFYAALEKAVENKPLLNSDALEAKYGQIPEYVSIRSIIGDISDNSKSSMWLAAKAVEGDAPVVSRIRTLLSDDKAAEFDEAVKNIDKGIVKTGECKFAWIDELISGSVNKSKKTVELGKFDRLITHRIWGKAVVVITILLGLLASFIPALPFMGLGSAVGMLPDPLNEMMINAGCPAFIAAIVCDVLIRCLGFVIQMLGFVFGVTFVFGLLEEIGVMARISYVFDNTMAKFGLQGKSVMPFLISFGCTMGGAAGTRVIDNWGQKVLTIALSWAIPCGAAWAVVPMLSTLFFGAWTPVIIAVILIVMILHMWLTAKIFGGSLVKPENRCGMIMELPPYHKPKWGALMRYVFGRTKDTFIRSLKVVLIVAFVFWLLSYTSSGDASNTVLFKVGQAIEPVTMIFGMKWQTFTAFVASSLGKEGALGVLSTIFSGTGTLSVGMMAGGEQAANLNELLLANITKPEALAFIFAITFNMPCIVALAATYQETHSVKWTSIIGLYYTFTALVLSGIAYHIGLLIW